MLIFVHQCLVTTIRLLSRDTTYYSIYINTRLISLFISTSFPSPIFALRFYIYTRVYFILYIYAVVGSYTAIGRIRRCRVNDPAIMSARMCRRLWKNSIHIIQTRFYPGAYVFRSTRVFKCIRFKIICFSLIINL